MDLIAEEGASLIRPFLKADCWVTVPKGPGGLGPGHTFESLPLHPVS